jgi:ABC-type bacteriocin/lantibiotic exporter with double-glycine peptidase domain
MSRLAVLKALILQYKYRLFITYLLFSLEMVGLLLRPFFLGMAVNDLIQGSYTGLIWLSLVHFAYVITGTIRHRYDTRTYSAIYTSLVTRFLTRRHAQTEVSRLSAHSNLAREFVNFLEQDLVYIAEAIFHILGSLLLLFYYNGDVVWICLAVLVPVTFISFFYGRKMQHLYQQKNDELEKQVDIISEGDNGKIKQHYTNLRKWQIKISDQEAWNFGIMEALVLLVIGFSLLVTRQNGNNTVLAGDLIGIYTYILKFVSGLDTIPYAVERFSTIKDITTRIELVADDMHATPVKPIPFPKIG